VRPEVSLKSTSDLPNHLTVASTRDVRSEGTIEMKMKSKSMRKKSVAVLAGLAIAGAVGASAASLGGLTRDNLGADTGVVAACDSNGITVGYTTSFDATAVDTSGPTGVAFGAYVVTEILLTDVDVACNGQAYQATLLDDAGAAISSIPAGTLTVASNAATITVPDILAESIEGIALTISTS
jgi:hypothetical protein